MRERERRRKLGSAGSRAWRCLPAVALVVALAAGCGGGDANGDTPEQATGRDELVELFEAFAATERDERAALVAAAHATELSRSRRSDQAAVLAAATEAVARMQAVRDRIAAVPRPTTPVVARAQDAFLALYDEALEANRALAGAVERAGSRRARSLVEEWARKRRRAVSELLPRVAQRLLEAHRALGGDEAFGDRLRLQEALRERLTPG